MRIDQVLAFARENGYETAEPAGSWRGFDVYEPIFDTEATEESPSMIGLPYMILVKGDQIRLSTVDEAFAYIDDLPEE